MENYKYVKRLDEISRKDFPLAGGKGSNLGEMIRAGLPVPEGFVILTSAYKRFVVQNNIQESIENILGKIDSDDAGKLEEVSQTIKNWFKEGEIPEDVRKEIALAYKQLGGDAVAVRSSATAEDLPGSSFAGQYDTYLNISGIDEICMAVKKCFASLWNARAISYRLKQGISHSELAHAVVVQRLIDGERAGILFTANPVNGRRDQMVINASWGLGEAIVSGEVSPDQWTVDRNTFNIVEEAISAKRVMTVRGKEGTANIKVPAELQNKPSLSIKDIKRLIEVGCRTESYFGSPQDIEWVICKDKIYILQSRDITALADSITGDDNYEWNSSTRGYYLWTNNMVGDVFPEVITPSTWSVWKIVWGEGYGGHPAIGNIGGRFYINYSFLYSLLRRFGKNHEQAVNLLAAIVPLPPGKVDIPSISISLKAILFEVVPFQIKLAWQQRKLKKNWHTVISNVPERCEKLRNKIEKVKERRKLISLWHEEIKPLFIQLFQLQDKFNEDFFTPYASFNSELRELIGEEEASILLASISGGSEELASIGPLLGLSKVVKGEMSREEYIRLYGHRHYNENELSVPRPEEDKEWFQKQLEEFKESAVNIKESLKRRSAEFEKMWRKIERDYPEKATVLKEKMDKIRETMHIRERVRSELTRSVSVIRKFFLKSGELTGLGEDIFFLTYQEVIDVLEGHTSSVKYITARKRKYAEYRSLPPYPQFIEGEFNPFAWAANPNRRSDIYAPDISSSPLHEDGVIRGCAASVGCVKGIVRRIDSPEEGHLLKQGEILVTVTTNVGWTPLFSKAAAVVTDVGAQLSHAAIVAREMGIPAVVGTGDATLRLKTGDRVMVDGAEGVVRVLRN
ncbi:MAG: pyruvate, phosphate dikinase [Firmicutes bacterium]|nr:pyruvate, phosphate dikinase [Bacillota bacterium]